MTRLRIVLLSVLVSLAKAGDPAPESADTPPELANPAAARADRSAAAVEVPAVVVHESRLMRDQLKDLQQGPLRPQPRPTLTQGGTLLRAQRGRTQIEAGAADWKDLFEKDAKFQSEPHVIRIELLRLKR